MNAYAAFCLAGALSAAAAEPLERADAPGIFSIYLENDAFSGTDRHYSNGMRLSWISSPLEPDSGLLALFPFHRAAPEGAWQRHVGLAFGQNIYTPEDTESRRLVREDRPYAGWSYFSAALIANNERVMDSLELQLGLVGRHSYAQDVQRVVHEWLNDQRPNGWKHQLEDEPGLNLVYQRKWRLAGRAIGEHIGIDFIPHVGASAGNVLTAANLGGNLRLGFNLPEDFGSGPILGGFVGDAPVRLRDGGLASRFGVHLMAGVDGRVVARDIFLDGNTFAESHEVNKEPLVADLYYGVGMVCGKWTLSFRLVHRTREFERQDRHSRFGSLTLSRLF